MTKRALLAALAAGTLSMATLLMASPAEAEDDGCTITDIVPDQAIIGVTGKRIQFDVPMDCGGDDVKFAVEGDPIGTSPHVAWFAACNYDLKPGPWEYDCDHDGSGVINPIGGRDVGYDHIEGNAVAGDNNIYAYAFVDANHNGKDDDEAGCDLEECDNNPTDRDQDAGIIQLLRQTRWAGTFNASPEPRRKGQNLTLSALLFTADWNTGTWANQTASAKIQFKGVGEKSYHSVKSVTVKNGELNYTTKAVRSGYWRVWFPGNDQIAGSVSNGDYVKVNPAKKTATTAPKPTVKPTVKPTTKPTVVPTSAPTTTTKPPTTSPAPTTTTDDPTTEPATTEPAAPTSAPGQRYANCTAMHADYVHGVRTSGGHDSNVPDSLIPFLPTIYALNTGLDRDHDGVACEA